MGFARERKGRVREEREENEPTSSVEPDGFDLTRSRARPTGPGVNGSFDPKI
jgi:hypothetical protein